MFQLIFMVSHHKYELSSSIYKLCFWFLHSVLCSATLLPSAPARIEVSQKESTPNNGKYSCAVSECTSAAETRKGSALAFCHWSKITTKHIWQCDSPCWGHQRHQKVGFAEVMMNNEYFYFLYLHIIYIRMQNLYFFPIQFSYFSIANKAKALTILFMTN